MKNNIIVIGSANIDMVIKTEKFPKPGETIIGGNFFKSRGGKGANQAVAAARLGGNVDFVTRLGDDDLGHQAILEYKKEGILTDHIRLDKNNHTGVALIIVNREGENKIVVAPGANAGFSEEDILALEETIANAELLLLQLEIPLTTIGQILKIAQESGTKVILNPAPAQSLPSWYLQDLFLISPNKTEAEQLTDIIINKKEAVVEAAQKLQSFGVKNVVITLGSEGVFVLTKDYTGFISAPEVEVIDTTAAGDVFNGALAVALTNGNGEGWERRVRFACNAAAVSVSKNGAQNSAPTIQELSQFNSKLVNSINS